MHRQMTEVIGYRLLLLRGFSHHGFQCEHNVAEEEWYARGKPGLRLPSWEGKHVRRRIPPAMVTVEPSLAGVVVEDNAELDGSMPSQPQGPLGSGHGQFRGAANKVRGAGTSLCPPDASQ